MILAALSFSFTFCVAMLFDFFWRRTAVRLYVMEFDKIL
jgi:hypothetical protein